MSEPADLPLGRADRELVAAALELLRERAAAGRHEVAAALRTKSGGVHRGLHVESSIGRASICAEGAAIAAAAAAGDTEIETIVAVLATDEGWRVVTPCGLCRELIGDYAPTATVIDYDAARAEPVKVVPVAELLPGKTTRRWRGAR
ncbi:MAG: cytidine deaminase [Actinobacteria bacterium]|nr:cytidine deaminase [Actinomycetota bacterium]